MGEVLMASGEYKQVDWQAEYAEASTIYFGLEYAHMMLGLEILKLDLNAFGWSIC